MNFFIGPQTYNGGVGQKQALRSSKEPRTGNGGPSLA